MTTNLTIADIRWQAYRLPFRCDFVTGRGPMRAREGAIVSVLTREGVVGAGEIAPLPEFGGASLEECLAALPLLRQRLIGQPLSAPLATVSPPEVNGGDFSPYPVCAPANQSRERPIPHEGRAQQSAQRIPAPTSFGIEVALLDAQARADGVPLAGSLSGGHAASFQSLVPLNAVIGASAVDEAVAQAQQAVAAGFGCVKLKVGALADTNAEIARVVAVRTAIGPRIHLRLDANGAWSRDQARELLNSLAACDIQYIEQPLPATDLAGMAALRTEQPIPIAADEALTDLASAARILRLGAADTLVIKPQMVGGWLASSAIAQLANDAGVQCVVTSAIESGVGVAAALQLAAALAPTLECGLATLDLLEDDLIREPLIIARGAMQVPEDSGLGVTLDDAALAHYAIEI